MTCFLFLIIEAKRMHNLRGDLARAVRTQGL